MNMRLTPSAGVSEGSTMRLRRDRSIPGTHGRWAGRFARVGPPGGSKRPGVWARAAHLALIGVLLGGGLVATADAPARALPRGETMTFPGGLVISNYVMPNGKRAYCIEIQFGEPTGNLLAGTQTGSLPGRAGQLHAWDDPHGMRQLNYLIDTRGQTRDPWQAAAVQITVWRMRENFRAGNPYLNSRIATLNRSAEGRRLIAFSDALYQEAKTRAVRPVPATPVTGKLALAQVPEAQTRQMRVSYPAGTTELSVTGGRFARTGDARLVVSGGAGTHTITVSEGAERVEVAGRWAKSGTRGWESRLTVHDTRTAAGASAQRIAVAVGASAVPQLSGRFAAVSATPPPPPAPPRVTSLAQPTAELGGTMRDELQVSAVPGTRGEVWPGAEGEFTAYLLPEAGSPKYDTNWEMIRESSTAPATPGDDDPDGGALEKPGEGRERENDDPAERLTDGPRLTAVPGQAERVPQGEAGAGPREERSDALTEEHGEDSPDAATGKPGAAVSEDAPAETQGTVRPPQSPAPVRWTAEEIAAMTPAERCVAQPVARQGGIPITGLGVFRSRDIPVKSSGTVHWVERVTVAGKPVHTGTCGLANETTQISRPGVVTKAQERARVGETISDTAVVSGKLAAGARYSLLFDAYREAYGPDGTPQCTSEQRIFRSPRIPVTAVGEVQSPGFPVRWAHGERIWWVESLFLDSADRSELIHTGACGLPSETTTIDRPKLVTHAPERAAIGDRITDIAEITDGAGVGVGTRWEVTFAGYRGTTADPATQLPSAERAAAEAPSCGPGNLLFETAPTAVDGAGKYESRPVEVLPEWAGTIWWVATLWLNEDGSRTPVERGVCGDLTESTQILPAELTTRASSIAAIGEQLGDVAEVTGELSARPDIVHEVTFEGYRGNATHTGTNEASCTDENRVFTTPATPVSKPGTVQAPQLTALPEYGETLWWVAVLTQRSVDEPAGSGRELARGECGDPEETTTILRPSVRTQAMGTAAIGEEVYDTAIVEGRLAERDGIEFRVRFTAYAAESDGSLSCTPEREIPEYSDPVGVVVTGPGTYESRRVPARADRAGTGGFVETLVMTEGDRETVVHQGTCGAPGEFFTVQAEENERPPKTEPLSRTGADTLPLIAVAGLLLSAALAAALLRIARTRRARNTEGGIGRR